MMMFDRYTVGADCRVLRTVLPACTVQPGQYRQPCSACGTLTHLPHGCAADTLLRRLLAAGRRAGWLPQEACNFGRLLPVLLGAVLGAGGPQRWVPGLVHRARGMGPIQSPQGVCRLYNEARSR
jgi:hypothetical protein